jgi:hypothetical protein
MARVTSGVGKMIRLRRGTPRRQGLYFPQDTAWLNKQARDYRTDKTRDFTAHRGSYFIPPVRYRPGWRNSVMPTVYVGGFDGSREWALARRALLQEVK